MFVLVCVCGCVCMRCRDERRISQRAPYCSCPLWLLRASLNSTRLRPWTIQLGREFLKESRCTPDPKISAELVHVGCDFSGALPLGSSIVGMQDVPESQRVAGLRLESQCEVQEWTLKVRKSHRDHVNSDSCRIGRGWETKFQWISGRSWAHYCMDDCRSTNGGTWWPYFAGNPCVNTHPARQAWWTSDMVVSS